jgi:hypothetical protein
MKGNMIPIQTVKDLKEGKVGSGNSLEQQMFLLPGNYLRTDKGQMSG